MAVPAFRSGAFDVPAFLRDHWQQRPLLIRNPWESWDNPVDPGDLAGLACEDEVEARLVVETRTTRKVEHGPFTAARLGKLGKAPWTLLVQAVDHYASEVAALIEPFRFVPNWRIDDVMVSYASDRGGVGPHFDQYDVFLIQGLGTRRWRVGGACDATTPLASHDDLRLLARFEAEAEWTLEPGDILYVPPGIAHDGIAVGDDCMTYSIGFRSPSRSELIAHWCDDLLAGIADGDRYRDAGFEPRANPGEITAEAIAALHAMVTETLLDRDAFAHWFGRYNSTPKYPEVDWSPEEPVTHAQLQGIAQALPLRRNPASRFAFVRQGAGSVLLFVDGETFACSGKAAAFAERLSAADHLIVDRPERPAEVIDLIVTLINQGSLAIEDD